MIAPIQIENLTLGPAQKTLLIAELSANHDRDLSQALALVDIAADAGWECVKFQTYNADSLTVPSKHPSMKIDPVWGTEHLYDLYETACMPMEFHGPLFDRARERGLVPFTSIYDPRDLDFVESLGCAVYKIASFELTFDDLLIEVAGTRKPLILSTGMANLPEVEHALGILDGAGSGPVILLHCCSSYPAPPEEVNLGAMATLTERCGRLVGFSDHTVGSIVPIAAAAMGAVAIEKHFTNDMKRAGPDHRFSATPEVLREIADGVAVVHTARGTGVKDLRGVESVNRSIGRRSAFALRDLPAGHVVTQADFRFVRPGVGVPANRKDLILGKALRVPVAAYDPILPGDLESE